MGHPPAAGILAVDQGTSNTKALFVAETGVVLGTGTTPVGIRFPRKGWVESDPGDVWRSFQAAAEQCLDQVAGARVIGIGISNQRESVLAWHRGSLEPLTPIVSWQCQRTAAAYRRLAARPGIPEYVRARTGLNLSPYYSSTKIAWLLESLRSSVATRDICIGTVDAWLVSRLTGGRHACDYTNASRTQLFDIHRLDWDEGLLELFRVPRSVLPEPMPSMSLFGRATDGGPVPKGTPIFAVIGDSHAALFAHRRFAMGATKATYGTGTSVMTLVPDPSAAGQSATVTSIAWATPDVVYCVEANIHITGALIQWLAEILGLQSHELELLARQCRSSGGVVIVPAFLGLGAPYWASSARGIICGLTRSTTRAQLARAAIEAIALQVSAVVRAVELDGGIQIGLVLADGGGSTSRLLMQVQADLLGCPVERSRQPEMSALGAAYVAGLGLDMWDKDALLDLPHERDVFTPHDGSRGLPTKLTRAWADAVRRSTLRPEMQGDPQ